MTPEGIRAYRAQGQPLYSIADSPFSRNLQHQTTGDATIDQELDRAVKIVAEVLGVNPAIGFYEPDKFLPGELDGLNAFSFDFSAVPGTYGVVAFGLVRFRAELYGYDSSGTTVMAIVAHEFGHIVQYTRKYAKVIGYFKCEINADFLSGYYLGVRKRTVPSLPFQRAIELFARVGRSGDNNPDRDHGDSRERGAAAEAGYRAGYEQKLSLDEAVDAGLKYIGYRS